MMKKRAPWLWSIGAAVALAAAAGARSRLEAERQRLGLQPRLAAVGGEDGAMRSVLAERQLALLTAGLGVLRPLALDFLWLRATHLQAKGRYFETGALSTLIARLEPRLPEVWTFQARNLAYNLPPAFPPADRFPWVERAVRLLRDEALLYNPENASICLELSSIFLHKIGLDLDPAGPIYRARLAELFAQPAGTPASLEQRSRWGIDGDTVTRLEEEAGVSLDFRTSGAHALYWAERGLLGARQAGLATRRLEDQKIGSVFQLYAAGRVLRAREGGGSAFLPEPRIEPAAERSLAAALSSLAPEDRGEARASFHATGVLGRLLWEGPSAARDHFARHAAELQPAGSLEELLARWLTEDDSTTPASAVGHLLEAALLLEAAGESSAGRHLREAGELLSTFFQRISPGSVGKFEDQWNAVLARQASGALVSALPWGLETLAPPARRSRP